MRQPLGDSGGRAPRTEYELRRREWMIAAFALGWVAMVICAAVVTASLVGQWLGTAILGLTFGFGIFFTLIRDQKRRRRELFNAKDGRSE